MFISSFLYRFSKKALIIIHKIINRLSFFEKPFYFYKQYYYWEKKDIDRAASVNLPELSDASKKKLSSFWSKYFSNQVSDTYYCTIAYVQGREPDNLHLFVSPYIMFTHLINILNPPAVVKSFSEKLLFPLLVPIVRQPHTIVGYYYGQYISNNYQPISQKQAIDTILEYRKPIIFKQSIDSLGGKGVELIEKYDEELLKCIFQSRKKNFIVQEVIVQSSELAKLNKSSLNTLRILTLLLNGKCTVTAKMLRHGCPGANIDNISSGGYGVGIADNGTLTYAASDTQFLKNDTHYSGTKYSSYKIPNFSSVCEMAIKLHHITPQCHFIAWDFALDTQNQPVLIEANFFHPGVSLPQIVGGKPIFDDRTFEVLDYCFKK